MEKKYEAIKLYIKDLIKEKKLKQGQRLPAIRVLAKEHNCNKSTIIKAYSELEAEHMIYSIPKSGYYLVEQLEHESIEGEKIDFTKVFPHNKLLPYKEFNHCINKAVENYKQSLFSYGEAQGLKSLRINLCEYLEKEQIFSSYENIVITTGAQQALSILCKMNFSNNKKVILVEQPTYGVIQKLIELEGVDLIGIERDKNGIDLLKLEKIFKNENVKFFYTIPRFHNPLGTSYSEKEKRKIVDLAEKYNVYIIEDDYLADINVNNKNLSMYYYDVYERVIYVRSFSKTFMPGIRIGAAILPKYLTKEFLKYKTCYDLNTSVLSQGALEIFIKSGMLSNHVRKVKLGYLKKMEFVKKCITSLNLEQVIQSEIFIPKTGFFIWIKIPDGINMKILIECLNKNNVYVDEGVTFFIKEENNAKHIRLCIANLEEYEIKLGLKIIGQVIQRLL
ncbi:GntR family transcriptional regulator [Clostridium zeae]|uniref:GntR family transcriptional regulator n=1 Tax=Clostridium zeae TaxID=2759022 RepID=A0ABQ1E9K2_9CLOT|nr:PLP-dependent aminotransferase family protein [Clostridium zeae]GFZ31472.1 GntR family transcriptional regulator [Clostridium zeae]